MCSDPAIAAVVGERATGWGRQKGHEVQVKTRAETGTQPDLAIIPPVQLGALAAPDELIPLPLRLKANDHPLQWSRILPIYRQNLPGWGEEVQGLCMAGDGFVLVYRHDLLTDERHRKEFRNRLNRPLTPPSTYEDLAEVADYFRAVTGKPTLPALPADRTALLTEFHQVAACYDRRALTDADIKGGSSLEGSLNFHLVAATGQSRLDTPGFVAAAEWLKRVAPCRMTGENSEPAAALSRGTAVAAVLSLADLARLPKDETGTIESRFRILPPPGTRIYFDANGKPQPAARQSNYVPYLGGGWLGVVYKSSPHADLAWDLLAELASPTTSATLVSTPGLGIGPFRGDHLASGREGLWLRYGFDSARTNELVSAIRTYAGYATLNPALPLRSPDQEILMSELEKQIRLAAMGQITGAEAITNAAGKWKAYEASVDAAQLLKWRRNAAGLQ